MITFNRNPDKADLLKLLRDRMNMAVEEHLTALKAGVIDLTGADEIAWLVTLQGDIFYLKDSDHEAFARIRNLLTKGG